LAIAVEALTKSGVTLESGLSDQELVHIEHVAGFRLPPDLRKFLEFALPTGGWLGHFPEWRVDPMQVLERTRGYLADGIAFDVENGIWASTWGPRPVNTADAVAHARRLVAAAPPLVPVYSHRFIPAEPHAIGNPVFSIVQTDIICYGMDLADYLHAEFGVRAPHGRLQTPG
jgi:hypothetical protein